MPLVTAFGSMGIVAGVLVDCVHLVNLLHVLCAQGNLNLLVGREENVYCVHVPNGWLGALLLLPTTN